MGDVIRRNAAAEDILADCATTLQKAQARGGPWKEHAEKYLGSVLGLATMTAQRRKEAEDLTGPLVAAVEAGDDRADLLLGRISDEVWNAVGRPSPTSDPTLSIMFPGGIAYYADGSDDEQPDRMDLLAEFFESHLHPKLDAAKADAYAKELRDEATAYRARVEAARAPRARLRLLQRMTTAIAKTAHIGLTHLKRQYKADGFSEAEIHTVIPHHAPSATKTAKGAGAKPTGAADVGAPATSTSSEKTPA